MAAPVLHRLVIRHAGEAAVFLVREGAHWRLPEVALEERHTADAEPLNAAVRERWAIETTVLRCLDHADTPDGVRRSHALEAEVRPRDDDAAPGRGAWISLAELTNRSLPEDEADLVRRCFAASEPEPADGCDWMRPGWWPSVREWIEAHVGPAEIVQTRAWESSCVARVQHRRPAPRESHHPPLAPPADFFFKALAASGAREARVTAYLSQHMSTGTPPVVAVDHGRRWLLMRAFDGRSLDDIRDPIAWGRAAATYGRLQAVTLGRTAELRALGCGERRLEDLAAAIEPLLADAPALMPGHPEGLSEAQIDSIRRLGPALRRRCETLAAFAIPPALDHGDLWPSNILSSESGCVVIDWEDAGISQPFLSLGPFLVMLREWRVPLPLERLAEAYLPSFEMARSMSDLREAFATALPLGLFEMAVRYWRMPVSVSDLHPWMREMVPFFLRHVLDMAR